MDSKSKPMTRLITKFQPMPMRELLANIKALPTDLSESSDDDSYGSFVKKTKTVKPTFGIKGNSIRDRTNFDLVHVMPTIEASNPTSTSPADNAPTLPPILEKDTDRCSLLELASINKNTAPESCPQSTTYDQQEPKGKATEPYPLGNSHTKAPNVPATPSVPASRTVPATPSVPASRTVPATPSAPGTRMVSATPTQPQTRTSTVQYKSITIKGKKYMYIRLLGSGGSSHVFKMLEIATSNEFALKSVNLTCDPEISRGYLNEVRVLRDLQTSDRVVKLYAYEHVKAANTLNLVLELGETSLASFLRRHSEGAPPALVLHYWEEMLRAVQQIHAHGIVHADLKPANFLLVSGTLKLIDFGIASKVSSDATSVVRSSEKGTFSYISPEALRGDGTNPIKVSFYSDVWSLGCILYSLVYGQTPFANYKNMLKIMAIQDPNHRINYPKVDHIPASLLSVLKQCLRYNGHSRPTVTELLQYDHITQKHPSIPEEILSKVEPHLTPREFNILTSAKVTAEALCDLKQ